MTRLFAHTRLIAATADAAVAAIGLCERRQGYSPILPIGGSGNAATMWSPRARFWFQNPTEPRTQRPARWGFLLPSFRLKIARKVCHGTQAQWIFDRNNEQAPEGISVLKPRSNVAGGSYMATRSWPRNSGGTTRAPADRAAASSRAASARTGFIDRDYYER